MSESLTCEDDIDSFFMTGRVSFTMSLFHVLRQSIRGLPKRPEVFDGGSAKDED